MSNPDAIAFQEDDNEFGIFVPSTTCADMTQAADQGQFDQVVCPWVKELVYETCGCPIPPTFAPVSYPPFAPTPFAPTPFAPSPFAPSPSSPSAASSFGRSNVASTPSFVSDGGTVAVLVDILTDDYPSEIGWVIKRGAEQVIVNKRTGYLTNVNALVSETFEGFVAGETYSFEIMDSYDDGICCTHGNGQYQVYAQTEACGPILLAEGGEYNSGETKTLSIPALDAACP